MLTKLVELHKKNYSETSVIQSPDNSKSLLIRIILEVPIHCHRKQCLNILHDLKYIHGNPSNSKQNLHICFNFCENMLLNSSFLGSDPSVRWEHQIITHFFNIDIHLTWKYRYRGKQDLADHWTMSMSVMGLVSSSLMFLVNHPPGTT